jgi:hypothetical protein
MKTLIYAIGALALAATAAEAAPVDKYTITGYAAASAVERGVPLEQSRAPQDAGYVAAVAGGADVYRGRGANVRDRATNQGAGSSRSSDANQG